MRSAAWILVLVLALAAPGAGGPEPLRLGILHSRSGTMADSERSLIDAATLAIEEINAAGGVSGRRLEPVVADGASDPRTFARMADRLVKADRVDALFGCWTSASRKAVLPVVERHGRLLFYPQQYEGMESSPWVIYTGAAPNQQLLPGVDWCLRRLGKRFYLVGSDYVFPRTANRLVREHLATRGGQVVGEAYRPLGSHDFAAIAREIRRLKPSAVLNTINGDSNRAFFAALQAEGLDAGTAPVMSFSLSEDEARTMAPLPVGHLASWNYFQAIDTPGNRRFVQAFQARFGAERATSDPMEASYFGVRLFARAVEKAGSARPEDVRRALRGLVLEAPEGLIRIDPRNQHTWKVARVGRLDEQGHFDIVWSSDVPLRPEPWP